jgi:hypothetical protein
MRGACAELGCGVMWLTGWFARNPGYCYRIGHKYAKADWWTSAMTEIAWRLRTQAEEEAREGRLL